jgi:hypothetical protein
MVAQLGSRRRITLSLVDRQQLGQWAWQSWTTHRLEAWDPKSNSKQTSQLIFRQEARILS